MLDAGDWTVTMPDGRASVLHVDPGPMELTCTDCVDEGMPCIVDQECRGSRTCIAIRGDVACASVCGAACQPFPIGEGLGDMSCHQRVGASFCEADPTLGWRCVRAPTDACGAGCPGGMDCQSFSGPASCEWNVSPWDGHGPCRGDRDCMPGQSCVEHPHGLYCDMRCRGDHPCPGPERCGPRSAVCPVPKI
jgi:hypothetical protein